jgi:thiamine-phosphate pyrophosphorylase
VGKSLIIGVSTHSLAEAREAQAKGADFVLFGPVFETESKRAYGVPQGVDRLGEVVLQVGPMPVIAIGGISVDNARKCLEVGAAGVAAISLFQNPDTLRMAVEAVRET